MSTRSWMSIALGLVLIATVTWAQSVFPVKLDRDEEVTSVPQAITAGDPVALHAAAIRLPPLDAPPFTCTNATLGYMYHQCATFTFSILARCVCTDDPDDGLGPYWALEGSGQACDTIDTACSNVPPS